MGNVEKMTIFMPIHKGLRVTKCFPKEGEIEENKFWNICKFVFASTSELLFFTSLCLIWLRD